MLKRNKFVKKTRRGTVLNENREHYLRKDIWCGYVGCSSCQHTEPTLESGEILVPDTNIVLHQIDLLEHPKLTNIVLLSTVLDEVKHRSMAVYTRARALVDNPEKRCYVFSNEYFKPTFIEKKDDESINDRNDRAIRVAAHWYATHVNTSDTDAATSVDTPSNVVMLSNDVANLAFAKKEGLTSSNMRDYVVQILKSPELEDLLALDAHDTSATTTLSSTLFTPHISMSAIQVGIKSKSLHQGVFHASRETSTEGFVTVHGLDRKILVKGTHMNRAVDRDVVAVRLFAQSEWGAPSDLVEQAGAQTLLTGIDNEASSAASSVQPTGTVVGIVKRNWRQYCGVLLPSDKPQAKMHLFVPTNRQIPRIRLQTMQYSILQGLRIVVTIDNWNADSRYPNGHFIRSLGKIGDADVETEVVLIEHDVPYQPFSDLVRAELPSLPWTIPDEELAKRSDFRDLNVCSIDPPGCTDIDDALHTRMLPNGNIEVGVHIADVTHFIRPGSACDLEAAKRATTVYLTNRRIDMVPAVLSGNLCSLRGGEERLAMSTIWELNENAEPLNVRFCKSVIKSKVAFMYSEAQLVIDDTNDQGEIAQGLRCLNKLAKKLRQRRLDNGALMLASPEVRFSMESETHDPVDVEVKQGYETNSLVEEFMLLANITVAKHITEQFPACALLRRHPTPPGTNFEPLLATAKSAGIKLDTSSSRALAQSLENAHGNGHAYTNTLLRILATRCMVQAVYFASGTTSKEEYKHYGLATDIYTHFTSPIRRYSDIVVHRLLAASIRADTTTPDLVSKDKTEILCQNLNFRHTMAQHASRASTDLFCQIFFKDKHVDEEAYILRIRKNAISVLVPRYGIEGNVFLDKPPKVTDVENPSPQPLLNFDTDSQTLIVGTPPNATTFKVFDRVVVRISVEESLQTRKVRLHMVRPQLDGLSVAPQSTSSAELLNSNTASLNGPSSAIAADEHAMKIVKENLSDGQDATVTDEPAKRTAEADEGDDAAQRKTKRKKKNQTKKNSKKNKKK
eukprot:m.77993 g.77993  ORF g.77993 m.77993 type:complete len:1019 (+) comp25067_c0_seq1:139-3195(+)